MSSRTTKWSQSSLKFSVILRLFWIQPDKEALFQLFDGFCIDLHLNVSCRLQHSAMKRCWWWISDSLFPQHFEQFRSRLSLSPKDLNIISQCCAVLKMASFQILQHALSCQTHVWILCLFLLWRKHHVFNTWRLLCPPGNELSSQQLHWLPWKSQVV